MKYPTVKRGSVQELTARRLRGEELDPDGIMTLSGVGEDVVLPDLEALSASLRELLEAHKTGPRASDDDSFEGQASTLIWQALSDLPPYVLDDPDFWAFLGLTHFWWLVHWREASAFAKMPANYLKYINGQVPAESVLCRMYLRGQIAHLAGDHSLAAKSPQAADFWRSHIVRVGTGAIPPLAGAFIRAHSAERWPTDELRQFARRVNRLATNVVVDIYDQTEADDLIAELRSEQ